MRNISVLLASLRSAVEDDITYTHQDQGPDMPSTSVPGGGSGPQANWQQAREILANVIAQMGREDASHEAAAGLAGSLQSAYNLLRSI